MNDNIDQIYLINKILQLTDRIIILEKKMQSYENNNNRNLFQQSTNSLNNIQNFNDIETIYDPINNNMQNNNINMQNNNINMQNNNINMQNNNRKNDNKIDKIDKIYDPLTN
jgi:vacuolar protein sorting-associated protein 13A/C